MGMAIAWAIIISIMTFIFITLLYLLFAVICTIIHNVGKDEFRWYAFSMAATYAKTEGFDSFGEMFKFGLSQNLKLCGVVLILALGVCIYVSLT